MQEAFAKIIPLFGRLAHQTFPSVIATLIAAGLIAGYNRAFSGHLEQPRMSALHHLNDGDAGAVDVTPKAVPASDYFAAREHLTPDRLREPLAKSATAEAGKDQSAPKLAAVAPTQPAQPPAARTTPRQEPRVVSIDPAPPAAPSVASAPAMPAPIARPAVTAPVVAATPAPAAVAPAPPAVVMAPQPSLPEPPPVFVAAPQPVVQQPPVAAAPMVTVPDRPGARPVETAEEPVAVPPAHGPIGALVNTLSPSSLFARARAFGERIEAAGNELLPNIRQ